jgi:hypothetical protein
MKKAKGARLVEVTVEMPASTGKTKTGRLKLWVLKGDRPRKLKNSRHERVLDQKITYLVKNWARLKGARLP